MFDLDALKARVAAVGRVVRVVVARHEGSSPREEGAAMLVWADGCEGTVGGGALEWHAIGQARAILTDGTPARLERIALGPAIGQCCGGAVTLLSEVHDAGTVAALEGREVIARPAAPEAGADADMPLAVHRLLTRARNSGAPIAAQLTHGWMVEPVAHPARTLWIWGAGHVGRAIVSVLAPLPDFALTWVDAAADRFPATIPAGVTQLWAADPADLAAHAPVEAEHLVLTYSHPLDLELCHRLLSHGHGGLGLIGSGTKAARFRSRLRALGHGAEAIASITCPIGDPALGKHPQAIALGVATMLLRRETHALAPDVKAV